MMLKLEMITQRHKVCKKKARWNELKRRELKALLDAIPFPTSMDKATYHHNLRAYHQTFPWF
jgi:hypothetical protein